MLVCVVVGLPLAFVYVLYRQVHTLAPPIGVRKYLEDFKKAEENYIDWIEARVEDFKKLEAASKRKPDLMVCHSNIVFLSFIMRIKVLVYG
jgi:hypothetical protein